MSGKFESLKNISEIVKNIFFMIAAAIGAWWALETYTWENPKYYEEGFSVARQIKGSMNIKELNRCKKTNSKYYTTNFVFETNSHLRQGINLNRNPLLVSKISKIEDGVPLVQSTTKYFAIGAESKDSNNLLSQNKVENNYEREQTFLIQLFESGIYLVEFMPCQIENKGDCIIQEYIFHNLD